MRIVLNNCTFSGTVTVIDQRRVSGGCGQSGPPMGTMMSMGDILNDMMGRLDKVDKEPKPGDKDHKPSGVPAFSEMDDVKENHQTKGNKFNPPKEPLNSFPQPAPTIEPAKEDGSDDLPFK